MDLFEVLFLVLVGVVIVEFAVLIRIITPVAVKCVEPAKVWIRVCDQAPVQVCESTLEGLTKAGLIFELEPRKGN